MQAWHVSILVHLHQCVQLAYMVLSNHPVLHPVLHIVLAESNAQASMHCNTSHALARGDQSH